MRFCFNINLKLFDINSGEDWWNLASLFDDCSIEDFRTDNQYAKFIYFIRDNENIIGFVYLLQYRDTDILNLEYGILRKYINNDYIYTVLTLLRDKIKGLSNSNELKDITMVSSVSKDNTQFNIIANTFGEKIYSDGFNNYYEINPNCEDLLQEKRKIMVFLNTNRKQI